MITKVEFIIYYLIFKSVQTVNFNETTNVLKKKILPNVHPPATKRDINDILSEVIFQTQFISSDLNRMIQIIELFPDSLCRKDSLKVLEAIISGEKWGLKFYDSSSKFPVGMMFGAYYQLGNFDECISTNELASYNESSIVNGKYCLTDIGLDSNNQSSGKNSRIQTRIAFRNTLHWAICVPPSCDSRNIEQFLLELYKQVTGIGKSILHISSINCYIDEKIPFSFFEILYGMVVGLFAAFALIATIYHIILIYLKTNNAPNTTSRSKAYQELLLAFSLLRNIKKLLTNTPSEANLQFIFGLKSISMVLILTSHTLLFILGGPITNEEFFIKVAVKPQNALLLNSPLLVDTFLLISGFLMCRLLLLELTKRSRKVSIPMLYVSRYARLTPAYVIVIGLYATLLQRLDNGPLWNEKILTEKYRCVKSWWANALYINNYVNTDQICMFQSWYLAVDTQLFLIAPTVVYPLWKRPKFGVLVLGLLTLTAIVIPFMITYLYKLDPTQMVYPSELSDVSTNNYFVFAYMKTHMRATSYSIGLISGYVVHKLQASSQKLSKTFVRVSWIVTVFLGATSVYSVSVFYLPDHQYNAFESAFYAALHKVAWSIFVGWILISCATGNSGSLANFLSWAPFCPLSRLTYCAYLVNGLVELYAVGTLRDPRYLSIFNMLSTVLAHCAVTFGAAFVLSVLFESPILNLEKCFIKKDEQQETDNHHPVNSSNLVCHL